MLNYLREMNERDMAASFQDTYLTVVRHNTRRAAKCIGFGEDIVAVEYADNQERANVDKDCFDLEQPDLGMMWWRGDLYYVSRSPERQWRRGFRERGLHVYKLEASGLVSRVSEVGYMSRHLALYFLEGHREHPNILSSNFGRRGKLLYFRNLPVGTVSGNVISLRYNINIELEGYEICQP